MKNITQTMLIIVLLSLPTSQARIMIGSIPMYFPEVLITLALFSYLFDIVRHRFLWSPLPKVVTVGLIGFILGSSVSVMNAGINLQELGALKSWVFFPIIFGVLIFQLFSGVTDRKSALFAWYIGIVVTAAISLAPLSIVHVTYDGRLASYFPSPNHLALFLEPGILFGLYFFRQSFRTTATWHMAFSALGLVLIGIALMRTESAGSLVSVLIGLVAMIAFSCNLSPSARKIIPIACAACVLWFAIPTMLQWKTLETGEIRSSLASRVMIWNASFRILGQHPILGIGLRTFQKEYIASQPEFPLFLEWAVPHPHNLLLAVWLQAGFAGLVGFVLLFAASARIAVLAAKMTDRAVSELILALFVVFFTHGLVDVPFFRNDFSLMFFALIGIALSLTKEVRGDETKNTDEIYRA
jgi:O-antigen ligase